MFEQAGLLTYPLLNTFPPIPKKRQCGSGSLLKRYAGLTAAGTVQESPEIYRFTCFPFNPKCLEPIRMQM